MLGIAWLMKAVLVEVKVILSLLRILMDVNGDVVLDVNRGHLRLDLKAINVLKDYLTVGKQFAFDSLRALNFKALLDF